MLSSFVCAEIYDLTIISPPDNFYTNNQTPSFTFSVYGNTSTNNCTLYIDELPYGTNDSIINGTVVIIANDTLSEATHTWYVNCSDPYGTNTTVTRTITVDVTAPTVTLVTVSDSYINDSDTGYFYVNIFFNESMNTNISTNITFDPSVYDALNPCSASWFNESYVLYNCTIVDINATAIGVNINVSLARDLAGNIMISNVSHSMFDINQTSFNVNPPTVIIDYPLDGMHYNVSSLDLNYTVTNGDICWYELDGGFTLLPGCTDSNLSGLSEGPHVLLVGINNTINQTATDIINFTIDTVAPSLSGVAGISDSILTERDAGGNYMIWFEWSEQMNQTINPIVQFSPNLESLGVLTSCSGFWHNATIYNLSCTINDTNYTQLFSTYLNVSGGVDLAGNMMTPESLYNVLDVVDMVAPVFGTITIDSSYYNNGTTYFVGSTIDFSVSAIDPGNQINDTSCSYSFDSLFWINGTYNSTHCIFSSANATGLSDDTIKIYVEDIYENNATSVSSVPLTQDITSPMTTPSGNGYTFNTWTANPVNVTFSCSDGTNSSGCNATYTCWDSTNTCTPVNLTADGESIYISSQGTFYVRYFSVDNLNNTETTGSVTINIDSTNPTISINMSNNTLIGSNSLPYLISGTASGGVSGISRLTLYVYTTGYNISDVSGNNWNFTWNPSEGVYNITAEVCDLTAACVNSTSISGIIVDLTAPNTINNANTTDWNNMFIITLTPNESVAYTSYKIGNLPWQNGTIIIINGSSNISSGDVLVRYYSVDSAGNSEIEKNFTVKYDITAPVSTIIGFLDDYSPYTFNIWGTDTALVNLSGNDTHSGINRTIYCTDTTNTCNPSTIWNETLNITAPGITYIRYRSIDNLNNTEIIRISRVMILQNNTIYINESLNVTENVTNIIVPQNNTNSTIYVPPNVNATLDFSQIINMSVNSTYNVTLNGSINVTVNTTVIIVIEIPQNTTISGNTSWLGNFNLAKLMPLDSVTVTPDPGYTATKDIVVEIGADDVPLLLDKAIRIRLEGKSAKLLGYYRNGFTKITAVCDNDNQEWADEYLNSSISGHCRITAENSTDLIIWTKHLSQFVTYTQTENENDGSGGGGGGGGSGGSSSSGGSAYVPSSTNTTLTNPSVSYSYMFLENGTRIINITHSQIPLYAMALNTNQTTNNVRLKITAVSNPPVEKAEKVYKYIQIEHYNLNDSIITSVRLQFKVDKQWLSDNKIEKNQIVLYRYRDGWTMLNTSIIKEDSGSLYYESLSPGLSLFAIATKPMPPVTVVELPQDTPAAEMTPEENTIEADLISEDKSNPIVVVIIVLSLIVILLYSFYAAKNKKASESSEDGQQNSTQKKK